MSSGTGDNPDHEGLDYREIAREVLARIDRRLADMESDDPTHPPEAPFGPDGANDNQTPFVRMARSGLIGVLLSASLVAAVSFLWSHNLLWSHNDTAKRTAGQSMARFDPGSATPVEKPDPGPPVAPKPIAEAAPAPASPSHSPQIAVVNENPPPAPVPEELAELMRKIEHNVADLTQAVAELRLAQRQAADDNAKTVDDIKATLGQMARTTAMSAMARAPEPVTQPRPPAPAVRTAVSRARRSGPMYRLPGDSIEPEFMR